MDDTAEEDANAQRWIEAEEKAEGAASNDDRAPKETTTALGMWFQEVAMEGAFTLDEVRKLAALILRYGDSRRFIHIMAVMTAHDKNRTVMPPICI